MALLVARVLCSMAALVINAAIASALRLAFLLFSNRVAGVGRLSVGDQFSSFVLWGVGLGNVGLQHIAEALSYPTRRAYIGHPWLTARLNIGHRGIEKIKLRRLLGFSLQLSHSSKCDLHVGASLN